MKKITAIVALLCACLGAVRAQQPEADFAQKLKGVSAATETIECDFTLTKTMSVMASDAVSKGHFYYLRGVGISLEFTDPAGDRIVMGRDRFGITQAGKTQVVKVDSNPMLRQLQRMLTACMTGDLELLKEGSKLTCADEGGHFVVMLTPNSRAKNKIDRIVLTFEKERMSLVRLGMEESSGDRSEYRFSNKKFNGRIDPSRFDVR